MKKGFNFKFKRSEVFVVTSRMNKTDGLASEIIKALVNLGYDIPDCPEVRKDVLYYLQKADLEIKTLPNGREMYKIHGKGFGCCGFTDEDLLVITIN